MNFDAFVKLTPSLSTFERDKYYAALLAAMDEFGISQTLNRERAFMAQLLHESMGLKVWEENLNYSVKGLLKTFGKYFNADSATKYAHNPKMIANRVYANRYGNGNEASGDGWKHRGMGPIQLTFAENQKRCGEYLGVDLLNNPELLLNPVIGFRAAAWFWSVEKKLNDEADAGSLSMFKIICKAVNGGYNGLVERITIWNLCRKVIV